MVNRMRHNRSQRGQTRSHHGLAVKSISACPDCGTAKISHKVCTNCGKYNGRVVIDVNAKIAKKAKKLQAKSKTEAK